MNSIIRHPETSLFEGLRISSDAAGVILSGAFPREDLIPVCHPHPRLLSSKEKEL